jgi:hypothetical protein
MSILKEKLIIIENLITEMRKTFTAIEELDANIHQLDEDMGISKTDLEKLVSIVSPEDLDNLKAFFRMVNPNNTTIDPLMFSGNPIKFGEIEPISDNDDAADDFVGDITDDGTVNNQDFSADFEGDQLDFISLDKKEEKEEQQPPVDVIKKEGVPIGSSIAKLPGYDPDIWVDREGNIYVNDKYIEPHVEEDGRQYVSLPTPSGNIYVKRHDYIVAVAYLPNTIMKRDVVIHKNYNPCDCRPSNLVWRSQYDGKSRETLCESDAHNVCEGLLVNNFNIGKTIRWCAMNRKRAYGLTFVNSIANCEGKFSSISLIYFTKYHEVKFIPDNIKDEVNTAKLTMYVKGYPDGDRHEHIANYVIKHTGDSIGKLYSDLKEDVENLTMFEVFNVSKEYNPKPTHSDIVDLCKYAKARGYAVKEALIERCGVLIDDKTLMEALNE